MTRRAEGTDWSGVVGALCSQGRCGQLKLERASKARLRGSGARRTLGASLHGEISRGFHAEKGQSPVGAGTPIRNLRQWSKGQAGGLS